jgi:HEPN domain-containing protein
MLNSWKHLVKQAERELVRAEAARAASRPVWAWFAAHQSAELAVKALRLRHSRNGDERMVTRLLLDLPEVVHVPDSLIERAHVLDSHYLPIRLPHNQPLDQPRKNGVAPGQGVDTAKDILAFVKTQLAVRSGPEGS